MFSRLLLGLLGSTGLRIGEAVRLTMSDVRLGDKFPNLQILQTKFQKSRIVPIHPTVAIALAFLPRATTEAFPRWMVRSGVRQSSWRPAYRTIPSGGRLPNWLGARGSHRETGARSLPHIVPPHLRREAITRMAQGRSGGAIAPTGTGGLPRTRRPRKHVLVPIRHSGLAKGCWSTVHSRCCGRGEL